MTEELSASELLSKREELYGISRESSPRAVKAHYELQRLHAQDIIEAVDAASKKAAEEGRKTAKTAARAAWAAAVAAAFSALAALMDWMSR